ncbi:IS66 family transposase [Shewanella surugensis]|uniref:IS66 family transposase n=1 Tax=Shewanella surugensis TaxID=212020 RepID=A0ABT0LIY9_9GAMM|nr:IS66 family transposase [Shewanella surugensis]MCL1127658.1 IS66 family transposase [Shewanella surugensis]
MKSPSDTALLLSNFELVQAQNILLSEKVLSLQQQLDWFKRQLFGRKSEKLVEDNPNQAVLFERLKSGEPTPEEKQQISYTRSTKKRTGNEVNDTGLRFDDTVPTKVIDLKAPELEGDNAEHYEVIGHKETHRLAQQPGSYTILIYKRPIVRHKTEHYLNTQPAPENVFDGCFADVSVIAGIMVDKGVYHLPLYRQHQRMLDSGVQVSRATLINWVKRGIELLTPIYQAMLKNILTSSVLAMDEVPMKAGRKAKGKMKQTYFWPIYGEDDEVAFTWSQSRGGQHAKAQLTGFKGVLLSDGYQAYTSVIKTLNNDNEANIVHATCWAHTRRYFDRALLMEPELAKDAIKQIGKLYKIEQHIRDHLIYADEILAYRQKFSEPIVDSFFKWLYDQRQRPDILPSNPLSKALGYALDRQAELKVFLSYPAVPIDTNHLERALRVIPMGRKNYLFCWTELGAEQLGMLQSLLVTCRLQGINPYTYLVDVLQRVSQHPASQVEELTPRMWKTKFGGNPLTSDLMQTY